MKSGLVVRSLLIGALAGTMGCEDEGLLDLGVYFVKLDEEPAAVIETTNLLATELGFQPIHIYDSVTQGFSIVLPRPIAEDVEQWKEVEYVRRDEDFDYVPPEEDATPVDDPPVQIDEDEIPESILRIGGPYLGGGLSNVHVAVIDTGVEASHPDLNVVAEFDAVKEGGGNAANGTDPNGHGTHVAGTIGAYANGEGVVGVAPGVPIHAVRVLGDDGSGYFTDIIAGLEYVLKNPEIKVVNMSLGGLGDPDAAGDPMREAIQALVDAGVVVCIAAGNSEDDTQFYVPSGYDLGVVVSAYDASGGTDNGFAWFSNYGDAVDIAAPGVAILSTYPGGGYASLDGTSMATPAVAGAAAAYLAVNPEAGPNKVRNTMINTGENGYKGQKGAHPEPLIDVEALLAQ